jgi:hypothetical protein
MHLSSHCPVNEEKWRTRILVHTQIDCVLPVRFVSGRNKRALATQANYNFSIAPLENIVKISSLLLTGALAAALAATAMPASAHGHRGGHARLGLYFGVPLAVPYYYPPAYYYGPRVYYSEPLAVAPTYYIQQNNAASAPPPGGYWYYCSDPQGYYPQVQQCPTPWQQVPAQPQTR